MSDTIAIYQFSRNFDNAHLSAQHNNRWVSGGNITDPTKRITLSNKKIPIEIRQAVLDGYFAINDSYPPAENDFALIAREIENKYAVLAVANGQIDDRGRPTIGYKYFWLEKTDPDIDGIGTLIYWWRDVKYQFDMEELDSASDPKIYNAPLQKKTNFAEHWLETIKETVNKFKETPCTGIVTKEDWEGLPSYTKLHYLAFGLSFRSDYLNSWAWNVQKLSSPQNFIYIWYSTPADIPPNLYKEPLPNKIIITTHSSKSENSEPNSQSTNQNQNSPSPSTETTDPIEPENPETYNNSKPEKSEPNSQSTNQNQNSPSPSTETTNPVEPENPETYNNSKSENSEPNSQSTNQNSPPPSTETTNPVELKNRVQPPVKQIKTCLTELARSFPSNNQLDLKKSQELFGYLTDYSNANWSAFIDQTTLDAPANQLSEIYKAEIYLIVIVYDDKQKWLIDLLKSIHVENKSTSFWDSLTSPFKNLLNQPPDNNQVVPVLEFQGQLLKESCKYDIQVRQRLTEAIYYGITFFLINLVNLNPNDQRIAAKINYLLIESQSIWSQYFQEYAKLVAEKIFYQPNIDINAYNSVRKFCETILKILEDIKNNNRDLASRNRLYGKYKALAPIFAKINRRDLAELFYRISGSQVPKEVSGSIPPEFKTGIFSRNDVPAQVIYVNRPPKKKLLIIIILILLFGVPMIYFICSQIINSTGYRQVSCSQEENWFVDYRTFESCYRSAETYQKNIVIGQFMPDQTNMPYANQEEQKNKATQFIDKIPKGDENEFNNKMAKLQECKKGKAALFGNCLENKEQPAVKCSLDSPEQVKNCNEEQFRNAIEQAGFYNIEHQYIELLKQYLEKQDNHENFPAKKDKSLQCFKQYPIGKVTEFNQCLNPLTKESVDELNKFILSKMPNEIIKHFSQAKPNKNTQKKSK